MLLHLIGVGYCEHEPAEENIFGSYSCGREGRTSVLHLLWGVLCVTVVRHLQMPPSLSSHGFIQPEGGKLSSPVCCLWEAAGELLWLGKVWEPGLQSCQVYGTAPGQSWLSIHETGLVVSWDWPSQQLAVTKLFQFSLVSLGLVMFVRMWSVESSSSAYTGSESSCFLQELCPHPRAGHSILEFEDWKKEEEGWKRGTLPLPMTFEIKLVDISIICLFIDLCLA